MVLTATLAVAALSALSATARKPPVPRSHVYANPRHRDHYVRDVYTNYPYNGPAIPIGDPVDQTVNGNGKGFPRLHEPPAVQPSSPNATNNINTIALAYVPGGMNIHFSTPFGLDGKPSVKYGSDASQLTMNATGSTKTYGRTPPCSAYDSVTLCSEYFHDVQITGLDSGKTYFYQIPSSNGTSTSPVLNFTTSMAAGTKGSFSVAVVNDMGYTNANGTRQNMLNAIESGSRFVWHGGDISYADDWYEGILPCNLNVSDTENYWDVCYNGSDSTLPPDYNPYYNTPVPEGEKPSQGGPNSGDFSTMYETNFDLWQNWMNNITMRVPYMVTPGNHEAACAEFDGPNNELTALLIDNMPNGTAPESLLNYYSCPPSQSFGGKHQDHNVLSVAEVVEPVFRPVLNRNFTAYQNRFRMPGDDAGGSGGRSNFWYSFDYGLAHFISFSGETDYYQSPEYPFVADLTGNETMPLANETYITDSGPFGYINGSYKDNANYEQIQWIKNDLAKVNRTQTPWVFAMSHRPMYSSEVSKYQLHMRNAFEQIFLDAGVDAYLAGHIHWYERMYPMAANSTIMWDNYVDNHTYTTGNGKALAHFVNGQAGNIESHSNFGADGAHRLNLTAYLDMTTYGFSKLTVINETYSKWEFIQGSDGQVGDYVYLTKGGK